MHDRTNSKSQRYQESAHAVVGRVDGQTVIRNPVAVDLYFGALGELGRRRSRSLGGGVDGGAVGRDVRKRGCQGDAPPGIGPVTLISGAGTSKEMEVPGSLLA